MISIKFKAIVFILLTSSVIYFSSCEKQKITYKNAPAPDGVVLPEQCEACHNNTYPEHSTNAHAKHTTGLYTFACSTCHFERGDGTAYHMIDDTKDINFNPNGLAYRNGADSNTPDYDTGTKTCSNVYCHSNGVTADRGTDGTYTWGTLPFGTASYDTTPRWDTGKVTGCTYCHNGLGNMTSPYLIERPNTMTINDYPESGSHRNPNHYDNDRSFGNAPYNITPKWDGVQCFWCHNPSTASPSDSVSVIDNPILQGTYGSKYHVDGQTFFKPLNISAGGTMANGLNYSSNGTAAHCGAGSKCW